MAKSRVDTHLSEDASEDVVRAQLPPEWVMRKLHPDYGVDVTIEVFERDGGKIPSLGEFLFVQLKSTSDLQEAVHKIRTRGNVEKAPDDESGAITHELDVIKFVLDVDTFDNARLMGPSTPLMLFLVDVAASEVYFVCLTDYYDKVLEPRGFDFTAQETVTVYIPKANRLSAEHGVEIMRFYAGRAKLYAMFNLAQFQFRESRYILDEISDHDQVSRLSDNITTIARFARRLRAMPIWDRPTIWDLMRHYEARLNSILAEIDGGVRDRITKGLEAYIAGDDAGLMPLIEFHRLCLISWEQFSAIGQTFEDIVREWFLPTYVGQLGSGDPPEFRELPPSAT